MSSKGLFVVVVGSSSRDQFVERVTSALEWGTVKVRAQAGRIERPRPGRERQGERERGRGSQGKAKGRPREIVKVNKKG